MRNFRIFDWPAIDSVNSRDSGHDCFHWFPAGSASRILLELSRSSVAHAIRNSVNLSIKECQAGQQISRTPQQRLATQGKGRRGLPLHSAGPSTFNKHARMELLKRFQPLSKCSFDENHFSFLV